MRRALFIGLPAIALAIAGCGGSSTTSSAAGTPAAAGVQIQTRALPGLGVVLVNGQGDTLYTFAPDNAKKVTCVDPSCTSVWPPLTLKGAKKPVTSGAVKTSLLGSDPGPSGTRVATYAGWPLYTYVADTSPGAATGQALNLNGGPWYVITAAGTVIQKKP